MMDKNIICCDSYLWILVPVGFNSLGFFFKVYAQIKPVYRFNKISLFFICQLFDLASINNNRITYLHIDGRILTYHFTGSKTAVDVQPIFSVLFNNPFESPWLQHMEGNLNINCDIWKLFY